MTEGDNETLKTAFEKQNGHLELTARISADRLKLFVDCKRKPSSDPAEPPHTVTRDEIIGLLEGVPYTLLHIEVLEDCAHLLNLGKPVEKRRVAKGRAPVNGRDGKLLLLAKKYQSPGKSKDIEVVDPRHIRFFDNVEKGAAIGRLYPPQEGMLGMDVLGRELKAAAGKPVKLTVGEGITVEKAGPNDNFQILVAQKPGYITDEGGKLVLHDELKVDGDVDFHTGDVDFVGSVFIKGDVLKDFRVSARGDITVKGSCINASLNSAGGSIAIGGGATGTGISGARRINRKADEAELVYLTGGAAFRCAGTLRAHLLQGVSAEAWGDIIVEKEVSGCLLHARRCLLLPSGNLIAGEVYTVGGVEARRIGTSSGTRTEIVLCSDIESSVDYTNLIYQFEQHRSAIELLRLQLGPYEKNASRLQLLKEPYKSKMLKLLSQLEQVKASFKVLEEKKTEMLSNAHLNRVIRVNFLETLFNGTVIRSGQTEFRPATDLVGPGTVEFSSESNCFDVVEHRPLSDGEKGST